MNQPTPETQPAPLSMAETYDYIELLRIRSALALDIRDQGLAWELVNQLADTGLDLVRRLAQQEKKEKE